MLKIDPKKYNLSSRTVLLKEKNKIVIVINRKSRIIMKDGLNILEKSRSIWAVDSNISISVATPAPICSKTREYLNNKKITFFDFASLNLPS